MSQPITPEVEYHLKQLHEATEEIAGLLAKQIMADPSNIEGRNVVRAHFQAEPYLLLLQFEADDTNESGGGSFIVYGVLNNPEGVLRSKNGKHTFEYDGTGIMMHYQLGFDMESLQLLLKAGMLSSQSYVIWTQDAMARWASVRKTGENYENWAYTFNVE